MDGHQLGAAISQIQESSAEVSAHPCIWLRCDSCVPSPATLFTGNRLIMVGESVEEARATAAKDGWRVIDGKDSEGSHRRDDPSRDQVP